MLQLSEMLPKSKSGNHISGQLVRCGSSPAFNYGEAQAAESPRDFIHKMGVVLKELRETRVCLKLIIYNPLIKSPEQIISDLKECKS